MAATSQLPAVEQRGSAARLWVVAGLGVVLAWAALLRSHATAHHSGAVATIAMWAVMTVAMMAPTAVPVLVSLRELLTGRSAAPWWSFIGAYLSVWVGFSVIAGSAQLGLTKLGLLDHAGSSTARWLSAGLLAAAGGYQFSALGLRHGLSCVGCCWALMALGFVGGVANVGFMVLAMVLMVIEKLPAVGARVTVPLGVALVGASLVVLLTPTDPSSTNLHHQAREAKEHHEHLVDRG